MRPLRRARRTARSLRPRPDLEEKRFREIGLFIQQRTFDRMPAYRDHGTSGRRNALLIARDCRPPRTNQQRDGGQNNVDECRSFLGHRTGTSDFQLARGRRVGLACVSDIWLIFLTACCRRWSSTGSSPPKTLRWRVSPRGFGKRSSPPMRF